MAVCELCSVLATYEISDFFPNTHKVHFTNNWYTDLLPDYQ